ncbi:hypothetical protein [Asticcacaulis sp. EMRT-3]|uniref:hypothetical protein n=1 Tax=Asticcacaulis sp. EMRT-3 TaxID=3040349 RepID=UPI0024AEC9D1|nr:hypothetical protein [Asticcacaulis sp. EMRT-3]MDI7774035.1 hypothetical protein [Asticcacaulis sp. EMRT-3]
MDDLLVGISPSHMKFGTPGAAEDLFEKIRKEQFPHLPSRLRSFFLSLDRATAEERMKYWLFNNRMITPCYLVLSSGRYHYADVRDFEAAAKGDLTEENALSYWGSYEQDKVPIGVTEVIADSMLYFPDWKTFPQIELPSLAAWSREFGGK